jgi:DNA-binding transcriptional MocR family regulator
MEWSKRVSSSEGIPFGSGSDAPYSLMYGWPDPSLFPDEALAIAAHRALRTNPTTAMQYGRVRGQEPLIDLVLSRLSREEGINAPAGNLLITTGSASAIGLAARALLDEGDVVLVEAPTFPGAVTIFRTTGAVMHSLPMNDGGIDIAGTESVIARLVSQGSRPRLLYTMPTFHNPTGLTTSLDTRRALLDLVHRHNLFLIEDDAYHDLYYDEDRGPLPPTLYALDGGDRVMRTGSFSKILAPGVRLGWALTRPDLIHKMMHLKDESGTSPLAQMAAAEFARDGHLTRYIAALRDAYRARRDAMLQALERHIPRSARWTRPMGGFFVWLTLPPHIDPVTLHQRALQLGMDYMPGEACFPSPHDNPAGTHLRLAFSQRSPAEIEEAISRLGAAIRDVIHDA